MSTSNSICRLSLTEWFNLCLLVNKFDIAHSLLRVSHYSYMRAERVSNSLNSDDFKSTLFKTFPG